MKKTFLFKKTVIIMFSCFWLHLSAQNKNVMTGYVISADDKSPLAGVNIVVKGTTQGTTTDEKGFYSIPVESTSTLVFSFIG